jgi:hypothetical protein
MKNGVKNEKKNRKKTFSAASDKYRSIASFGGILRSYAVAYGYGTYL